jgi:hypothetical protein
VLFSFVAFVLFGVTLFLAVTKCSGRELLSPLSNRATTLPLQAKSLRSHFKQVWKSF